MYKLKRKLFWFLWGKPLLNELKYRSFFNEVWEKENIR